MGIFKKFLKFFKKRYWIFLLIVVLVSYGQLLGMYVWQDDNALFFKLANLAERAGYLGAGPLGEGVYKYTAAFYIPIHKLFGFNTFFYFLWAILFYFLSTLSVYFVFSKILGKKGGRIAGFLFASGYIASDGFIRLYNSIITSLSIIFISFFILFYWNFIRKKKNIWYIFSLVFFLLAVEFARARTHYLVAIVLLIEALFLAFRNFPKSFLSSVSRIIPFAVIFYGYFIFVTDERSGGVGKFISSIIRGELFQFYGLISALTSLTFPDWLTIFLVSLQEKASLLLSLNLPIAWFMTLALVCLPVIILLRNKKIFASIGVLAILFWIFVSREIFSISLLDLTEKDYLKVFLGGVIIGIALLVFTKIEKRFKVLFLLFLSWLLVNIASYSAYNPLLPYESIHRYLAHSFFALIGVFSVIYVSRKKDVFQRLVGILIILWGAGNLMAGVFYQREILAKRSTPARNFYRQLKSFVPEVEKGTVFYFDVLETAAGNFAEAFSVAQMPETTAIAWRYGIDRYDIQMFTDFDELAFGLSENKFNIGRIYTFFYGREGLVDTTEKTRAYLRDGSRFSNILDTRLTVTTSQMTTDLGTVGEDIVVSIAAEEVYPLTPLLLNLELNASPLYTPAVFPYRHRGAAPENFTPSEKSAMLSYLSSRESYYQNVKVSSLSEWRQQEVRNILDKDPGTAWRGHRIWWHDNKHEQATVDLGSIYNIGRVIWQNWKKDLTPTSYKIETSVDGKRWVAAEEVKGGPARENGEMVLENVGEVRARYVRMDITSTLMDDSPAIAEIEVVSSEFFDTDPVESLEFLDNPFSFVETPQEWQILHKEIYSFTKLKVNGVEIPLYLDGRRHVYEVVLPAGGTSLGKIELRLNIPVSLVIESVRARNLSIEELKYRLLIKSFKEN